MAEKVAPSIDESASSAEEIEVGFLRGIVEEIVYSPLNLLLVGVIIFLIYKIVRSRSDNGLSNVPAEPELPKLRKDFTLKELKHYDGTQPDGRVLIAVNGHVYDVTKGRKFYGPGKCWAGEGRGTERERTIKKEQYRKWQTETLELPHERHSHVLRQRIENVLHWNSNTSPESGSRIGRFRNESFHFIYTFRKPRSESRRSEWLQCCHAANICMCAASLLIQIFLCRVAKRREKKSNARRRLILHSYEMICSRRGDDNMDSNVIKCERRTGLIAAASVASFCKVDMSSHNLEREWWLSLIVQFEFNE